eukprot:2316850-Pyramimonas_sp.AAC.1
MTFGSTPDLSLRVGRRLGALAGTVGAHVVSLGVDLAPGVERNTKQALGKRKARVAGMICRRRRLQRYRKALPRDKYRIGKIYTAGVKPAVSFGDT